MAWRGYAFFAAETNFSREREGGHCRERNDGIEPPLQSEKKGLKTRHYKAGLKPGLYTERNGGMIRPSLRSESGGDECASSSPHRLRCTARARSLANRARRFLWVLPCSGPRGLRFSEFRSCAASGNR